MAVAGAKETQQVKIVTTDKVSRLFYGATPYKEFKILSSLIHIYLRIRALRVRKCSSSAQQQMGDKLHIISAAKAGSTPIIRIPSKQNPSPTPPTGEGYCKYANYENILEQSIHRGRPKRRAGGPPTRAAKKN
ncbi:hypothetical protein PAAG_03509 [Paracoccidioides lutzii Pb01]|uniref:Uncharacterized protein n=1 Tax=Paracoccidioides lutzii (strain ATCC MYA-826 / Pb01) TaxID=502779 RepID=C1GXD5_PARBA|nr:hypothetical protein PAAG_03509 [Paracoccidioides lutzii Pb01]EEH41223.2 hypothetical protein PAAG_03509 [Paracoccidioides lutzii Pb01]